MDAVALKASLDKLGADLRAKFETIQTEIGGLKNKGGATAEELDALGAQVAAMDAAVQAFDPDAPAIAEPVAEAPAAADPAPVADAATV